MLRSPCVRYEGIRGSEVTAPCFLNLALAGGLRWA